MTLDFGPSDGELDRVVQHVRDAIVRGPSLPIFYGCSEGERAAKNDPVLFHDQVERCRP